MMRRRHSLVIVAALYFGLLVALTFMPGSEAARRSWVLPILLFVPVGQLLALLMGRRRWWVALGFGFLGAAWIEAAQTLWMPSGYASVEDIALSSAGAALGVGLGVVALVARSRSHGAPRIVSQAGRREIPQD